MSVEDEIREVFASLADEVRRQGTWSEIETRVRRTHRRRTLTIGILSITAIAVLATSLPRLAFERRRVDPTTRPPANRTYQGYDWRLQYPSAWRGQAFSFLRSCRFSAVGLAVASFGNGLHPLAADNQLCREGWDVSRWPDDGVVVEFFRTGGGPVPLPRKPPPDTPLPYRMDGATSQNDSRFIRTERSVVLKGNTHHIRIWVGPRTTEADKETADRIVASIAPAVPSFDQLGPIALADPSTMTRLKGTRHRVVAYQPYGPFGPGEKVPPTSPCYRIQCVLAQIYVYSDDTVWTVSIDPDTKTAVNRGRQLAQPPLNRDEQVEAHDLAEADTRVKQMIAGKPHSHRPELATRDTRFFDEDPFWKRDPCGPARCAYVLFLFEQGPTYLIVWVDLSARRVAHVQSRPSRGGISSGP